MNHEDRGHWGDLLRRKKGDNVRLLMHNTGGIGFMAEERSKETLKSEKLRGLCNLYNIDLAGLYENNKDWRQVDQKNNIWNATSTWSENRRVQAANNITKPSNAEFQVGGMAMVAFDDFVFGITKQGSDSRKLGRWVWMTVTGRNNCNTTIITCYCPVKGTSPGSVYAQHLLYMAENNIDMPNNITCPRQLFGHDLKILLANKATEMLHGEQVAKNSEETAKQTFADNSMGKNLPSISISEKELNEKMTIIDLIILSKLESSKSEIRRLIKGNGIKIDNQIIADEKLIISKDLFQNNLIKLSLGKKKHIKVELS